MKIHPGLWALAFLAFFLPPVAAAEADPSPSHPRAAPAARPEERAQLQIGSHVFHRRELANGLGAVAVQDDGATVSVFVVVGAGNRQESPETSGLAHLTEHAMFSGTPTTGTDVHEETVEGWGGESNAFTRDDYTLYYDHDLPPERLTDVLAMEADRLRNLSFTEEPVLSERGRLATEEANTYQPSDGREQELEAAVFRVHPYRVGLRDADGHTRAPELDIALVRAFYDRYYHPRNTAVVVAGPIAPAEALDAIEAAFGGLEAGPLPEPVRAEPWLEAAREERIPSILPRDRVELCWLVPEMGDPARPALRLLARWLERAELAGGVPVEASAGGRVDRDLFRIAASGDGAAEGLAELALSARTEAPPADELAEVRALARDEVSGMPLRARPYFSLAATFGVYEVLGRAELLAEHAEAIDAVGPEDVLAAARRWLDPERCVTVVFVGTGAEVEPLPEGADELHTAAMEAADGGDYARAIEAYERLLDLGPNRMNTVIYLATLGQIRVEMRDYDRAIADYEAALAVVDYPAVHELLEEAHALKKAALRGEFADDEEESAGPEEGADGDAPAGAESETEAAEPQAAEPETGADAAEAPEPGSPAELLAELEDVMAELETWRGLEFTAPVEPEFLEDPPDDDEKLGGWYESDTGRLVVVLSKGRAFSRGAQLHEVFHALQDQHWDLGALHDSATTTDAQHALQALIEGEAMLAVSELMDYDFEQHAQIPAEGEVDRARFEKIFHYGTGLRFVRALRDGGSGGVKGWEAVNRAWEAPPRSTAELLHPDRYPLEPRVLPAPAVDGAVVSEDVLGEFELRWLLVAEPATRALADGLAPALAADRLLVFESADGATSEQWELHFASELAARRLVDEGAPGWEGAGWSARREGALVVLTR